MKRLTPLVFAALLLAGCGSTTVTYKLSFNVADEGMQHDLTLRGYKVIQRRLQAMQVDPLDEQVQTKGADTEIVVTLASADAAKALTADLTKPFTLQVMKQVEDGKGDITIEGQGSFAKTGVDGKHLTWVEATQDDKGKGVVRLDFTTEGKTLMSQLFKENKGNFIGIFVRDRLISKLKVQADNIKDNVVIQNIPSPEIATIFADDVNVGLHVTFTPVP